MKSASQAPIALFCALVAVTQAIPLATATERQAGKAADATPIIAEVYGRPAEFIGRRVAIYGLVVKAQDGGQRFFLQDVSQMPLMVTAPPGQSVGEGAQLMVTGTVRRSASGLELASDELTPVKVVAGGGCC